MKNYDETISSVFDRIGEYEKNQKRKRSSIVKNAVSFCCVCAIALVGIGVLKGNRTPTDYADDALYPGIKDTFDDLGKGEAPDKDFIIFNAITERVPEMAGIALMRDDFILMSKAELNEYFGFDVFPTCPDGFEESYNWMGIYKRSKGTGEVYWDTNKLLYTNSDNSKTLVVDFGTNRIVYLNEDFLGDRYDDIEKSVINNIEISIAEVKAENYFYAEFMHKGANFSVWSEGVTQDEFIEVISSLVTD